MSGLEIDDKEINDIIPKYGERYFGTNDPKQFKKMLSSATTTFLPRMEFEVTNVGSSLGIIFPRAIARMLKLEKGMNIEVTILPKK